MARVQDLTALAPTVTDVECRGIEPVRQRKATVDNNGGAGDVARDSVGQYRQCHGSKIFAVTKAA